MKGRLLTVVIVLLALSAAILLSVGCAIGVGVRVKHAPRCEVQTVAFYYADGTVGSMELNACRFGAVGRHPFEDHK